jgi:hypothetical protein
MNYVTAVLGVFIVFVCILWFWKRGRYEGPVSFSFLRTFCSVAPENVLSETQKFELILGQHLPTVESEPKMEVGVKEAEVVESVLL